MESVVTRDGVKERCRGEIREDRDGVDQWKLCEIRRVDEHSILQREVLRVGGVLIVDHPAVAVTSPDRVVLLLYLGQFESILVRNLKTLKRKKKNTSRFRGGPIIECSSKYCCVYNVKECTIHPSLYNVPSLTQLIIQYIFNHKR